VFARADFNGIFRERKIMDFAIGVGPGPRAGEKETQETPPGAILADNADCRRGIYRPPG
jgi:hypothetical protein